MRICDRQIIGFPIGKATFWPRPLPFEFVTFPIGKPTIWRSQILKGSQRNARILNTFGIVAFPIGKATISKGSGRGQTVAFPIGKPTIWRSQILKDPQTSTSGRIIYIMLDFKKSF